MKEYAWRKHGVAGCSAQTMGEMIESIEKKDGSVTKKSLLDASRPEESPTHNAFDWDDSSAAEKYRLSQAGFFINNICVKVVSDDTKPVEKHVAFVNVVEGKHNTAQYKSVRTAYSNKVEKANVLKNALMELKAFQDKYNRLEELTEVFDAINDFERRVEG